MKYTPRYIIYWAVCRYLNEEQTEQLKKNLTKGNLKQDRRFLTEVKKVFDLKVMLHKPYIREDAWIYNYIEYDMTTKFPRKGLIVKYENQVVIPVEKTFREFLKEVGIE